MLGLFLTQSVSAQTGGWSNNSNVTNSTVRSGDVGIGMSNAPTEKLEVVGNIKQGNNLFYSDAGNSTINFNCKYDNAYPSSPFKLYSQGFSGQFAFGVGLASGGSLTYSTGNIGFAKDYRSLTPRFTILNTGLVGIGITTPTELLQIMGGSLRQGNNFLYSDDGNSTLHFNGKYVGGSSPFQKFATGYSGSFNFSVNGNGALVYSNGATGNAGTNFNYQSRFAILNNGAVAIGADAGGAGLAIPSGYLLAVKGKIICEELKVKLYASGWPDYIFSNNYKLTPIQEVQKFIEKNHHLPNMPSAKELEKNEGFLVSKMITNQQEKIEELMLYLIEQNKKIELLEHKIDILNNKK